MSHLPPPPAPEPLDSRLARWGHRTLLLFGGSDYLRRSWSASLRRQLSRALLDHGPDVAASRVTTGNLAVYTAAERALARFAGTPAAVLTSSGYSAALVAAQALAPDLDRVWLAPGAHPCLKDAARLTGRPVATLRTWEFPNATCRVALFMDGLGALTGRLPPLAEVLARLPAGAQLLLDDAHGIGTLGSKGRGAMESLGLKDPRVVLVFTLSKAFGLCGGVIAGSRPVVESVWAHSGALRGSTPIPPAYAAVIPAATSWMTRHGDRPRRRLALLRERLARYLPDCGPNHLGPVFLMVPAHQIACDRLRRGLVTAGIFPSFIRYPGGPGDGAYRFALGSAHTLRDIDRLGLVLAKDFRDHPGDWVLG